MVQLLCVQSCLTLCDPMNYSLQAPLSMKISKQGYWSGLPFPTPGDLPSPGIKPTSLVFPALVGSFFTTAAPGKPTKSARGHVNAGATRARPIQQPLESHLGLEVIDQRNSRAESCIVLLLCHHQYWVVLLSPFLAFASFICAVNNSAAFHR